MGEPPFGIRVRLEFQANEIERCWYFVDFAKLKNIKHLRSDICNRFRLDNGKVDIYVDDYLLISQEAIHILRDNDLITVKQSQRNLKEIRREKVLHRDVFSLNSKKKRKRKRTKKKKTKSSDQTMQHPHASEKIIFTPPTTNATSKHKYFDLEEIDETFGSDGHPVDSTSETKILAIDYQPDIFPSLALVERKSFADCPPLIGIPRVDDLIAYKELIVSSDFTPQVSSYRVGKALSYCDGYMALSLIKKSLAPMLKEKFDICFDDEIGKDSIDQQWVVVSVSTLIEPKLVNSLF